MVPSTYLTLPIACLVMAVEKLTPLSPPAPPPVPVSRPPALQREGERSGYCGDEHVARSAPACD